MENLYEKKLDDENGIFRYISPEEDFQMMLNTKYLIGKEEGYKIGYKEGYEEGYKIGVKQQLQEMALSLLEQNIPIEVITTATGLDYSEIESLKQKELPKN